MLLCGNEMYITVMQNVVYITCISLYIDYIKKYLAKRYVKVM